MSVQPGNKIPNTKTLKIKDNALFTSNDHRIGLHGVETLLMEQPNAAIGSNTSTSCICVQSSSASVSAIAEAPGQSSLLPQVLRPLSLPYASITMLLHMMRNLEETGTAHCPRLRFLPDRKLAVGNSQLLFPVPLNTFVLHLAIVHFRSRAVLQLGMTLP